MNKVSRQTELSAPLSAHPRALAHPLRGYLFIASAAFLWGVSATLGRAVFTGKFLLAGEALHAIDPIILSQTRTTFSLLILLPILVGARGWQRIQLPRRDLIQCLVLGMLGVRTPGMVWLVYPLLLLETVGASFFEPAHSSVVPNIVPPSQVLAQETDRARIAQSRRPRSQQRHTMHQRQANKVLPHRKQYR